MGRPQIFESRFRESFSGQQSVWTSLSQPPGVQPGHFAFVDDFLWLLRSKGAVDMAGAVRATPLALGTPLSWKKTHLAEVNTWLGFLVHPNLPQVLMAANKHILVMEVLQIMVEGQARHAKEIEKALWVAFNGQRRPARCQSRCLNRCGPGRGPPPRWENHLGW